MFMSHTLGAGKSKIKTLANLLLVRTCLLISWMAISSLLPHRAERDSTYTASTAYTTVLGAGCWEDSNEETGQPWLL